ncbi:rab11 family-interacting 5 isoform X1 [Pelobates cultripes]|uniref:Rab11 family-interacting 5 isoform X1 n=1 Tax=Pelobates cultripes TaxID=61616 RepID=A0AAD1SEU9_PELCU|nr:rab11 family-interacting 5 isoform X1 [Pelobates cultripes]
MYLRPEPDLGWLPTHVQVTILQARGLRAKGKHGTSDAYTLIQITKEKYSTSVVEKSTGSPEWKEECTFELAPGALERGESCELQLTVMHRALIGMDQFLGQVCIPLQEVYKQGRSLRNQWYKLRSKPGRKEKERGEIEVSIQFTRNNLTASMFDLSVKDKPKTPFGKLKDKMKVKKLFDMESSSAIVPSSVGRLDSDDEDERKPKSKAAFFLKGRLRKSSLTKSNTSLGSDSTISNASGTVPTSSGISIVLPDVGKKPAARNSSLSTEATVKDNDTSSRMTHKRAFSDEVSQLTIPSEPRIVQDLKPKGSPISKSSLCINGSHVYAEVPLPKPSPSPLEKFAPASKSFQNIVKKTEDPAAHEGPGANLSGSDKPSRKPDVKTSVPTTITLEEAKTPAKIAVDLPKNEDVRLEFKPIQITTPLVFSQNVSRNKSQENVGKEEKKPKVNLFHHGPGKNEPSDKSLAEQTAQVSVNTEEKSKAGGWFGSKDNKDAVQKPSFPSGSIAASEAAGWGSSLVEEHSLLAFSPSAEDQKVPSNQSDHGDVLLEAHKPKFTTSSISEPITSEWEEQFDAFASSRLQPVADNLRQLETKILHYNDSINSPLHSGFSIEGMGILADKSKTSEESEHGVNISSGICKSNLGVQVLETHWPVNFSQTGEPKNDDRSPFLTSDYKPHIPAVESSRIRTPDNIFIHHHSNVKSFSDKPTEGIESNNTSGLWHLDETVSVTELSVSNSTSQKPISHSTYAIDKKLAVGSEIREDDTLQKSVESIRNINRIAAVPPFLSGVCDVARVPYFSSSTLQDHQSSSQSRLSNNTSTDTNQVVGDNSVHILETLQYPLATAEGAHSEPISYRLGTGSNEEIITNEQAIVGDRVNEPEARVQVLSEPVGFMVPPKPPRLLSPTHEWKEPNGDNYKQTSNQDVSAKQTQSPEEKMLEQNNGVGKQTVSPVACCPVIEVISPVQSIGEDTQSTTEGLLANLKEGNNELTKLGATNGEHLLDVNESTLAEQFRTCPSKVSLDVLDLSSAEKSSNKLDVLKYGPGTKLINHESSTALTNPGDSKPESEKFSHLLTVSKEEKDHVKERSGSSHKVDNSGLFWSALEEPLHNVADHGNVIQNTEVTPCDNVLPECEGITNRDKNFRNMKESKSNLKIPRLDVASKPQPDFVDPVSQLSRKELTTESQSGLSLSHLSSWSADIVVDFKNEGFWKSESDLLEDADEKSVPSPGNPFTSTEKTPPILSHKNPFIEHPQSDQSTETSLQEDLSFKDLHVQAAFRDLPPTTLPSKMKIPSLHDRQPLAFSTPSLVATQNPKLSNFPSPIISPTISGFTSVKSTHAAALACFQSPPTSCVVKTSALSVLPQETLPAENPLMPLRTSPHPVKPISATLSSGDQEKKPNKPALTAALSSGLEVLKSVTGGQQQAPKNPDLDRVKDICSPDMAAKYYHLTHDELIHMLLQKETELGRKENHVRELEDYIDKLLVRIMDQAPTLLQVPLETKMQKK